MVMVSAKIFTFKGVDINNFSKIFEKYDRIVDRIEEMNLDLKENTESFRKIDDHDVAFTFQCDFKYSREFRGREITYPATYKSDIWVFFAHDSNYVFIFDEDRPAEHISGRIEAILRENGYDSELKRISISNESLLDIIAKDFVKLSASWLKRIGEDLRAAFLSGRLRDSEGENDLYKVIAERAGEMSSATYLSRKLGINVTISRKKGSIAVRKKDLDPSALVDYFREVVYPVLLKRKS